MQKQPHKNKIAKIGLGLLLCALLVVYCFVPVLAEGSLYQPDFDVQAEAVYLVNGDSDLAVYQKNADTPLVMASLVKMMTCLVAIEKVQDLDAETVTAKQWVFDELYGKNASNADIWKGETLTVRELLHAMLMPSANEAALMLAEHVSGGYIPNFLYMMNSKAAALGCTGTTFADPNGLSTDNITTARDMYLITKAFMANPVLVEIASSNSYEMAAHNHPAPYYIATTNRFLVASDPYAKKFNSIASSVVAGKTGSLGEWQNFASKAVKDGVTYYCIVLNSPNAADALAAEKQYTQVRPALYETGQLYEWVFANFSTRAALDVSKPITEIRVKYSTETTTVRLMPESDLKTVLPNGANDNTIIKNFHLPEYLSAPLKQGEVVGTVTLVLEGQEIGTANLLVSQDVNRNWVLFGVQKIGEFFGTVAFKILLVVLVLAIAARVLWVARANKNKKQQAKATQRPPAQGAKPQLQNQPKASGQPPRRPPQNKGRDDRDRR
ncbi:serine hydrolase [Ruminococcaceae bacterium OttesenSCG-928-A16]|nr:serine hydrolase [Ruminococcaceae bacterium OttesenSCG-928-A16]